VNQPDNPAMTNAATPLHLVGNFDKLYTGAERELPDLANCLRGKREVRLWSGVPVHPGYAGLEIPVIDAANGVFPRGGMLLLGGVHVPLDWWLTQAGLERVAVRFNLPRVERLLGMIAVLRSATGLEPEVLYASSPLKKAAGWPGPVEHSLILLDDFLAVPMPRGVDRPFTVGRASRDVPDKHDAGDPMLYRMLASRGIKVRIMGGTCLADQLGGYPGIELIETGAEPMPQFLASLDAFVYRTGAFYEPYGRVIFEAMASGLPVVVARRGGFSESIDNGSGGFVVDEQEEAFDRIMALANDSALHEKMARAARARAIELHGTSAVQALVDFYLA
jgi:hypothetical protein